MFINSNFEKISFSIPNVSAFQILRTHGYKNKSTIKKKILESANIALERLSIYSLPVGYFCINEISQKLSHSIVLKDGTVFKCEVFDECLKDSKFLIIFVLSLGKRIDEKLNKISNDLNEPLGALFLENACWLALELILKDARLKIVQFGKSKNMMIENRMAPGNSYPSKILNKRIMWELKEQRILFKLFENKNISVRINEYFTMIPRMSRSGIFGLKSNPYIGNL